MMSQNNESALPTDETTTLKEKQQVYPNPEGYKKPLERHEHTEAVKEVADDVRHGVLDRAFNGMPAASAEAKSEIGQYFETKDYASHSPLLKHAEHAPEEPSLTDRVRAVTGRR